MSQLTDTRARSITSKDKPLAAGGVPGLYLFPSSTRGRGKWILRFVSPVTSKRRDMGLGTYPEVGIAAARRAGLEARELIRKGTDPIEYRKALEAEKRSKLELPTFEVAARIVHAEIKVGFKNRKHVDQWLNTLETYAFPVIGFRLVTELKAADFAEALRPIWLSKPETASRVRQRCDTVMIWCAAQDYIVASPVEVVSKLLAKQPSKRERVEHHPAVPWRDIPKFVQTFLGSKKTSASKLMLELLILTAARSGEIRGMEWKEIDFQTATWTIPASRMKAKASHRVPLPPRAVQILTEQHQVATESMLVFPSRCNTLLSDMTLTKLLRDGKVQSDVPGRIATAHGFRSAFRDWRLKTAIQEIWLSAPSPIQSGTKLKLHTTALTCWNSAEI